MPSGSGTTKLLCRQWKIEDGARSHGLGEKGGKGLPFFNESLRSHWANHQGDPSLGTMPPTNVIQKDSQKMINDYVDRLENTHTVHLHTSHGKSFMANMVQTTLRRQHVLAHRFREASTPLSVQTQ